MGDTEKIGCFMGGLDGTTMRRGPECDSIEFRPRLIFFSGIS